MHVRVVRAPNPVAAPSRHHRRSLHDVNEVTPDSDTGLRVRNRWGLVAAYAALSASNQMLWLTFTPVTTDAAAHFGVSVGAIGWLAQIFPLLYVVLALPAGRLLDRWLVGGLGAGAVLTAVGAVVRVGSGDFTGVLIGQVLVAVAQPLVLNSVTKVSGVALRPDDRVQGIAVSSAGIFAGMVLALGLGTAIGGGHIGVLLILQAALTVVAAGWLCLQLRTARSSYATPAVGASAAALRAVWADHYLRALMGLVLVGFGVFIGLTTWLQALLEPAGVSATAAGAMLLVMVLAGVAGSAVLPPWVLRRDRPLLFILASAVVTGAGCLVLAFVPGVVAGFIVLVIVGAWLLTDLPLILELAERRAGDAGATATGLLWLAGNLGGLVVALVVQALVDDPTAAFVVLAACLLPIGPLLHTLRPRRDGDAQAGLRR